MLIRCECGWEKTVKDDLLGKKAQCPKCSSKFVIEPAPELVAAAVASEPELPTFSLQAAPPSVDHDEDDTVDGATMGETEDMPTFEELPAIRPPARSPWKTHTLPALRDRLKGHYPLTTSASWCLQLYGTFCHVVAALLAAGAVFSFLGVLGGLGMMAMAMTSNGSPEGGFGGSLLAGLSLSYLILFVLSSFTAFAIGSLSGAGAELIAGRAAALVDQGVSPNGGVKP